MDTFAIFATTATAIVIEAAPFLLLGSLVGSLIEVLVPEKTLLKCIPRSGAGQIGVGLFAGMLLPSCECGIVPVARKLLLKGVPPRTAIPYMMAAPVINPVVMASTLFAFQGSVQVVALRILMVLVPAAAMGMALGSAAPRSVLRHHHPTLLRSLDQALTEHEHEHGPGCTCGCHGHHDNRFLAVLFHTASEFVGMLRFLVLGAVVAACFKTLLPYEWVGMFAGNPFLAVPALMLLAILLSVCSEADAFVAASFASFPLASQLAFMAVGPMVDLKLIPMFLSVFHRRVALALMVVPVAAVFFLAMIMAWGA